jgi:hypothetical protein
MLKTKAELFFYGKLLLPVLEDYKYGVVFTERWLY